MNGCSKAIANDRRAHVAALFDPYFTLMPIADGPLQAFGPNVAYERMTDGSNIEEEVLLLQRIMPPAFRAAICTDLGRGAFAGLDPLSVPLEMRTKRWQDLCDRIRNYGSLHPSEQNAVAQLLMVLGYYEAVWGLNAEFVGRNAYDVQTAGLAYTACAARYIVHVNQPGYRPDDLLHVAERAPEGSKALFLTTSRLLMFYGRFAKDAQAARYWRERNHASLIKIIETAGPFWSAILESRFWRSAAFVPMLDQNWKIVFHEMKLAENCAQAACPARGHEEVLHAANLYPVLQSKARLHTLAGEPGEALRVTRRLVEIDPLYSTAHVDLGQALLEVGAVEEAARRFATASTLGPPVDAIGAFLAGHSHATLGDTEKAREFYKLSLEIDPQSISSKRALAACLRC